MHKSAYFIPIILFLLAIIANGRSPLTTKGEAREGLVVKNMLEQNNYILPLRNSIEIPSKPPLFHWVAAGISGNSASEFAVRFPSALFALVALSLFIILLKRINTEPVLPVLVCASAFEWMRSSQAARVDMTFSAMLCVSLVALFILLTENLLRQSQKILFLVLLALGLAGSILSKGPAGAVIALAISGIFFLPELLKDPKRGFLKTIQIISPISIGCLLAAWWYYKAYQIGGEKFLDVQLFKENISRLTGDGKFEVGHEKPFFMGPVELILAFLPWSLFLPFVIKDAYKARGYQSGTFKRFCLIVVIFFLVICSIATSKRPVYFLPVFPFLAYLVSESLRFKKEIIKKTCFIILGGYAVVSIFVLPYYKNREGVKEFSQVVNQYLEQEKNIYQVANDFYPTLFYVKRGLEKVNSLSDLTPGTVAVVRQGEEDTNLVDVLFTSIGKVDDGRARLLVVRRRAHIK